MHELSFSQTIARTVLEKAKEQKAKKILSVNIEIGELTFLNPEQVKFWLEEIFKKTQARGSKIHIKKIYSRAICQDCHWEGKINMEDGLLYHTYFFISRCPQCGSSALEIKKGRECLIRKIKVSR